MSTRKNFILDTNVILHDSECLKKFQENDIYIPITVVEELDGFKKGNEQLNYNARQFIRTLDRFASKEDITKGVSLGEDMGRLYVVVDTNLDPKVHNALVQNTPDHRIISIAIAVARSEPETKTILVSKDANLRLKALAFGVQAEDYKSGRVENIHHMEQQHIWRVLTKPDVLARVAQKEEVTMKEVMSTRGKKILPNSCFELREKRGDTPLLCRTHGDSQILKPVEFSVNAGIKPRNIEQQFAFDLLNDDALSLVAITGTSGTGKTLLAIASAIEQKRKFKQILIARPIVSLSNKDLGFLPGGYEAKVEPYMQPIFDNINVIKDVTGQRHGSNSEIDELLRTRFISVEALAYIRGRSLSNVICIIDEAQNLTPLEIKTIITRAGEGTKIIFSGDIYQIDSPYLDVKSNGLSYMIDRMAGQEFFAHVHLEKGERSLLSEKAAKLL